MREHHGDATTVAQCFRIRVSITIQKMNVDGTTIANVCIQRPVVGKQNALMNALPRAFNLPIHYYLKLMIRTLSMIIAKLFTEFITATYFTH